MNAPIDLPRRALAHDEENHNPSANPSFQAVLDARLSRRSLLRGGVGTAATMVLGSWSVAACGGDDEAPARDRADAATDSTTPGTDPNATTDGAVDGGHQV